MKAKHTNRESWLIAAVECLRPVFSDHGYKVPPCSVTCGWPSKGATAKRSRRIGECWTPKAAADKRAAVFISPVLAAETVAGECGVLAVLVHELVHAVVGVECGHKGAFKQCATAVGLVGKMTSTTAGEELMEQLQGVADELGPYPHGVMNPADAEKSGPKKQGTRMIKCECGECGYTVRTTKKWLEDVGAPHCPQHGAMAFEMPESD